MCCNPTSIGVGGVSTCLKIAAAADAAGISVMVHGGGRNAFGQHFSLAMPAVPWLEYFVGSAPGVPLAGIAHIPANRSLKMVD